MDFVFYYIGEDIPDYVQYFVASIRTTMPQAKIHQLTDMQTPSIEGTHYLHRKESKYPVTRGSVNLIGYQYLVDMPLNSVIFTDPDMFYAGDISSLMEGNFDVAVAMRPTGDPVPVNYAMDYPFCSLMVVKNPLFWLDCYYTMLRYDDLEWSSNMKAVAEVIKSGKYNIRLLDGNLYNAMPDKYDSAVKVYHCKGSYKKYMEILYSHLEREYHVAA